MNPDSQNFDSLRRLLALKRHEQPPPGYFNRFSRDVMARIKAGESGDELAKEPWFQRIFGMFELKPVFAGAFGMGVCTLLISGVFYSDSVPTPAVAVNAGDSSQSSFVADVAPAAPPAIPVGLTVSNSSISLFDQYQPQFQTERAVGKYWVPGNN